MEPTTAACSGSTLKEITRAEGRGDYPPLAVYELFLNGRGSIASGGKAPLFINRPKPFHLPVWTGVG